MILIIALVIVLPVSLFVALIIAIMVIDKRLQLFVLGRSKIDFNSFIQYHNKKLYVDGNEEPNVAKIALAIQQRVGSERDDFTHIENLTE